MSVTCDERDKGQLQQRLTLFLVRFSGLCNFKLTCRASVLALKVLERQSHEKVLSRVRQRSRVLCYEADDGDADGTKNNETLRFKRVIETFPLSRLFLHALEYLSDSK